MLSQHGAVRKVDTYGELPLEEGIVVSGMVQDVDRLSAALAEVKKELGHVSAAHAALPEELAYVFSMHLAEGSNREQALRLIEFEFEDRVPIPPSAAVYDYNPLSDCGILSDEAAVVVFPKDVSQAYADAFERAGLTLLSLEVEARSIARATMPPKLHDEVILLVDFGKARTGLAVLKRGFPIFTSTVNVGGETMTQALMQKLSLSPEAAEVFKNERGLLSKDSNEQQGLEVVSATASALADEITKHFHYWDTRRNEHGERVTPVSRVVLVGGSSNLKGLTDYIAGRVQAPTMRGNVWQNVAPPEEYIPPIDRRHSLQYATSIGLALRGLLTV